MIRLTDEQKITLDRVRKVADREIAPRAKELDEKALFPEHARDLFADLGLLNPLLPAAKLTQIYTGTNQITRLVTGRSLLLS
jgi:alkylation response protein AidB-like acyl-CoA dehydrogenase